MSWQWKSNLRFKDDRAEAWSAYSAWDSAKIEQAYQRGETVVDLNDTYQISFTDMLQHRIDDPSRQRPVRRVDTGSGNANDKKRKEPEAMDVEVAEPEENFVLPSSDPLYGLHFMGPFDDEARFEALTCVEQLMVEVSQIIRKKPDWQIKFQNPEIFAKWRKEIEQQVAQRNAEHDPVQPWRHRPAITLPDAAWDFIYEELKWYVSLKDGSVEPSLVDGVWQAMHTIPGDLKRQLEKGVAPLENVPEHLKDWHPGSNNQVLDLVHPSLFCLVYNVSRKLKQGQKAIPALKHMTLGNVIRGSNGDVGPKAKKQKKTHFWTMDEIPDDNYSTSESFQWLPAEFNVNESGKVTIESYINNLHPIEHKGLYFTIASVFEHFVPLFEKVLSDLAHPRSNRLRAPPTPAPRIYREDDEEDGDDDVKIEPVQIPKFRAPTQYRATKKSGKGAKSTSNNLVSLRGRRLQVIVKLANIILTPDNPAYKGGAWHVEGMRNESIVASGIYYYHSENISESVLSFRQGIHSPIDIDYDEDGTLHEYVSKVYGMDNGDPLSQKVGGVVTKEDLCVAFPNVLQHQVQPFELLDKKRPGFRKILVFFLVDPTKRIISTETVPPQQAHWWADSLRQNLSLFFRLPKETVQHITSFVDGFPMSMDQAKQYRALLMEERKYFVDTHSQHIYEREFSLCEH